MNKNTVLGFVLIGVILIGFSWYNSRVFKDQERERFVADSIARVEAARYAAEMDSLAALEGVAPESLVDRADAEKAPLYKDSLIEQASKAAPEFYSIENEKLKIEFTTKGAQPYTVLVKDYYTYDSLSLYLVKEGAAKFDLKFYAGGEMSTSNFVFRKIEQTDSSIVMRLNFSEDSYIDYAYNLPKDSYLMDFDIRMVGMEEHFDRRMSQMDLDWSIEIPRLEKGYDNEKNYSTIAYKYPNEDDAEDLGLRRSSSEESIATKLEWVAFQQQFFSAILRSENSFNGGELSYAFATEQQYYGDNLLMACDANLQVEYNENEDVIPLQYYFGPNLYKELKSYDYGFEKIVPLGGWLIGWINRVVIINCFDFLSRFISNYGLIIFLLTIIIKLVISPLTLKSYVSSAKMRVLKPEVDKINEKYPRKEDAMKRQQETMALYSKAGVSMLGGCLPLLLQFPILFAMFRFFPASFELRQEGFLWADDLSGYDSILDLPFHIPLYGDHVSLFALLMAVSLYLYSRMNLDQMASGPQMAGMRTMQLYFMPLFMLVLCNNFSSGLSYYYMLSNLITILQTWVIRKYFIDEKKLYAKLQAKASSSANKKSKWQVRLEEMQRRQAQMQREREKQFRKR
ncbi:MAG: membrane protein insertase YidC [Bacteroidetes bacterium]|uniref:Membrane protein insertase YidC n=1 Tax=Candidatus Egerieousia excrementavium TaxID=2840778 RepID=A0A9D9GVT0_9BACT|nr:membrane protein insertase YidC [Candidatus Egerieousia excrementavium]